MAERENYNIIFSPNGMSQAIYDEKLYAWFKTGGGV